MKNIRTLIPLLLAVLLSSCSWNEETAKAARERRVVRKREATRKAGEAPAGKTAEALPPGKTEEIADTPEEEERRGIRPKAKPRRFENVPYGRNFRVLSTSYNPSCTPGEENPGETYAHKVTLEVEDTRTGHIHLIICEGLSLRRAVALCKLAPLKEEDYLKISIERPESPERHYTRRGERIFFLTIRSGAIVLRGDKGVQLYLRQHYGIDGAHVKGVYLGETPLTAPAGEKAVPRSFRPLVEEVKRMGSAARGD